MSPQHMREVQAEIAGRHGVMLEATARLERGIAREPAGLEEVYAAREEGRARREPTMDVVRAAEAEAAMERFAAEQGDLADLLDGGDHPALARATRAMSDSTARGQPWEAEMVARTMAGAVSVDEIRTVGDAIEYAEARWEALEAQAVEAEPAERARFEIAAAEIKSELTALMPDAELRDAWTSTLEETYPPGADLIGASESLRREGLAGARPEAVETALQEGRRLRLDVEEMAARIEAGGTRNHGLAQEWTDRDVAAILARDGLKPQAATEAQREAATERLDAFQDQMRSSMLEAGAEADVELAPVVVDLAQARAAREAERGIWRDDRPEDADPRGRERTQQAACLAAHPELLSSPEEVYTVGQDGVARLREDGQAPRVMRDLAEMGVTGREPDAEARIAGALAERHPDMLDHVARDMAVTYAATAELAAARGERSLEPEIGPQPEPSPDLSLQALADRLRREDLAPEEKEAVAAALEANLHRRLGPEGMARLDEGDHSALEDVLPSVQDRMNITFERLDLKRELAQERGRGTRAGHGRRHGAVKRARARRALKRAAHERRHRFA